MQLGQSRTLPVEKPELIDLAQAARYFGARGEADTATMALLQRCAAHCASATDIEEAFQCGKVAVESALRGETGKMVGMVCKRDGGYSVSYELFDLRRVANAEKKIPLEWITSDNAYVTDAFIDYCTPLLEGQTALGYEDGLPRFARLKKVFAK